MNFVLMSGTGSSPAPDRGAVSVSQVEGHDLALQEVKGQGLQEL
jgi:hypothetical protein